MPDPLAWLFGLEQFGIKFGLENISRQLVWTFLHSYPFYNSEQSSQRYVKLKEPRAYVPPLSGAALDVFLAEPLPKEHVFWTHPGIVLTPHDACDASLAAVGGTVLATAEALRAGVRPGNVVDRGMGY